ncbi:MAG: bifunctional folylpolyglutamate synthase/dihydrofolate synthase [Flavobacteriia bacterium]|nr:bifunctional folylpolyglutamate synthase/dihydrofolate synthase [Flavobacteriia bacterium]
MRNKYKQTIDWLFKQFPSYQEIGAEAYKPGLERVEKLLNTFSNPHLKTKTIHVAGTNGKGSTCSFIASILTEKGEKVGLFTSPHIFDFKERILINGTTISEEDVVTFCTKLREIELPFQPSFFEITFVMAMEYFAAQNCTYAIIETGLGGRLDATNVVQPLLSIITNIGLDHQNFLGNTIEAIAAEKAGIIKNKVPVFVAEETAETKNIFLNHALEKQTSIQFLLPTYTKVDGIANYQQTNLQTAIQGLSVIGIEAKDAVVNLALRNLYENTGLFGRFQKIQKQPQIIIDAAHNEAGIKILLKELQDTPHEKLKFIVGSSGDKDLKKLISNLPSTSEINLCVFKNERSTTYKELSELAAEIGAVKKVYKEINAAINEIVSDTLYNETIVICGSFFLISDIKLSLLKK